ncbi:MFS transporter [Ruminiclostridium sufflavum DSM 19573]|uniref:MFS transporter n=1 Tax=Ruminiclostridium sufflavum DSM 19573 TaxID=1121337 RepID=A0A318XPL1_9FIRM|nr:MFS transporter [Ruminiclostridium sufflavum]PYG90296.1 MFS transporter [Ruminiclostridium sufflavum DSM 19573]
MSKTENFTQQELKRSLFLITAAVIFGKIFYVTINGAPFTGFLRELGANDLLYSIIAATPYLGGVLQIFASYALEKTGKRKMMFLISGYIHRLIWIPIVLIPVIIPKENKNVALMIITILIIIYSIVNSVVNISYNSWMGDIVPASQKGSFFGKRTAISAITGIIAGVAFGKYLDNITSLVSFAIVFTIASIFGALDASCFIGVKEPPMTPIEKNSSFISMLIEPFKNSNYLKLIIFISCWNFGFNFSIPFLNIYMIEQLKIDYFTISIFQQLLAGITTVFFINKIGLLSDKYGTKPILRLCCYSVCILPLMWCIATPSSYIAVMSVSFLLFGLFSQGIVILSNNFSIWLAPEKNRSMYLANYSIITTLSSGIAYICAGAFMEASKTIIYKLNNAIFGSQVFNNFHILFAVSSLLMICSIIFVLPSVYDKDEKKFSIFNRQ